jgi:UDP-perosamine 4-acetyltransferase
MQVFVIGAGGQARVVIAALTAAGRPVAGVLDDGAFQPGEAVGGAPILGRVEAAAACEGDLHVALGDNRARQAMAARLAGRDFARVIHPHALVDAGAQVGVGAMVGMGAMVHVGAVIGDHAIINTGAIVEHDCRIGHFAHVAPGARLAGGVSLGEGVLVGIGACILPGVWIGDWAVVGAGSVVTGDVAAGAVVKGAPAR